MKKIAVALVLFSLLWGCKTNTESHRDFLAGQRLSSKDYVLELFKKYDLVILCERDHKEFTQYELFRQIVQDLYFTSHVRHIFTEVGACNMDGRINRFLSSPQADSVSARRNVTAIFREIDSSPWWHCYNYPWFMQQLSAINQSLPAGGKLEMHPSDIAFDWSAIADSAAYIAYEAGTYNRDSIMACNVIRRFDSIKAADPKAKALVIMNYKHAFLKDHRFMGQLLHNTGRYLADRYPGKVASVYIMGLAISQEGEYTLVQEGKWDCYFESAGITDMGFDLARSPFGKEAFDAIPPDSLQSLEYCDMFTGLIYYQPVSNHRLVTGWEGFTDEAFLPELRRRTTIFNRAMDLGMTPDDIEGMLWDNNTVEITRYWNADQLQQMIDRWKNDGGTPVK